jgi:hypothetical protein
MRLAVAAGISLFVLLPGCRARSDTGHLELSWTGSDRGALSAPAAAQWCSALRLLEIRSVMGDTGAAVAIYPAETLVAGTYPIRVPTKAEAAPPAAAVALRWAGPTSVKGFQGESGMVVVERSSRGVVSGRVSAAARSATDTGSLAVTGQFRDLPLRSSQSGCVATDTVDAPRRDTLVH